MPVRSIATTSLVLTFAAGFADAATFIGADKLFSAHITGNFIVLAYDLIHGADRGEWSKLLAFPVFFVAVMVAGRIDGGGGTPARGDRLLRIEGSRKAANEGRNSVAGRSSIGAGGERGGLFAAATGGPGLADGAGDHDHCNGYGFSKCFWAAVCETHLWPHYRDDRQCYRGGARYCTMADPPAAGAGKSYRPAA